MPIWTLVRRDGLLEHVDADRIERDGPGWAWWTVVLVVNDPRWACMRRVNATDVIGEPVQLGR